MGALHHGHLTLVDKAVAENDLVVVSIFVNPLQFNEASDFDAYPRNLEHDLSLLAEHDCDMVFTGSLLQFFPEAKHQDDIVMLDPGPFALGLEGDHRPGHFAGVRTIVDRLFHTALPVRAYFGEKDFQQTLVIQDLARSLGYPDIRICSTERESNGLAMSSRNQRLSEQQRLKAGIIYQALVKTRDCWQAGERDAAKLQELLRNALTAPDIEIEYAEIRDPFNWTEHPPEILVNHAQALVAVKMGPVRLIDNLALHND